ncbi:Molybdate transporter 1, partial [Linum perenne]
MPAQPMKSIAAVAVSETPHLTTSQIAAAVSETPHLTTSQIAAAGISTASVLLFLGATGLMSLIYRYLPLPVVRGVQLSQGLGFAFSAIKYIQFNQDFLASKSTTSRPWLGRDGILLALSSLLFLVITGSISIFLNFSGIFTSELYVEDCLFEDPTISFRGTDLYSRNLKLLVPFFDDPSIRLQSIEKFHIHCCRTYLRLPWRPLVLIDGVTVYELNEDFQ